MPCSLFLHFQSSKAGEFYLFFRITLCAFSEDTKEKKHYVRLVKAPKETKSKTFEAFREAPTINHDMMFFLAMKAYNNLSTEKVDKE